MNPEDPGCSRMFPDVADGTDGFGTPVEFRPVRELMYHRDRRETNNHRMMFPDEPGGFRRPPDGHTAMHESPQSRGQ